MRKYFPLIVFAMVSVISLAMAGFAYIASDDSARIKFEALADDALNRIESRIDTHVALLRTTRAYFEARPGGLTREEYRTYFNALDVPRNFTGLRGMGLLGRAPRDDEAALQHAIDTYYPGTQASFAPSNEEWRTPILMFEPINEVSAAAIGYDMFTDPESRAAITAAIDTGEPRATGMVDLGQTTGDAGSTGVIVFAALRSSTVPTIPADGVLYAALRSDDLFKAVLEKYPALPVHADVFDGKPEAGKVLYRSETAAGDFGEDFVAIRRSMVAGRPWVIEFRPTTGFERPSSRGIPITLGLFGLLLAAAIALVARYQEHAFAAMTRLNEASESSLLEKDLMLQEMKHRIKNSITRVLAIARQTAANSENIDEFSSSFSARLQAMAASQDMLTRSRWQKADLGDLLRIELGQVFGKELPPSLLKGPAVLLSEAATQALGLTFHELATNALKYGEAGNSPDALRVRWDVKPNGQCDLLRLVWSETGSAQPAEPKRSGFGTKLIDMNIERELLGRIERSYTQDGLEIEIEIPLHRDTEPAARPFRQRLARPRKKAR